MASSDVEATAGPPAGVGDRVSTLELFFDLVFVFTITQIALIIEHEPSWSTVAQAILELLAILWMYGGFAWLTNSLGASTSRQRIVLLLGMAAFLIVSLTVPRAFGADGVAFGYAYLLLTVVHLVGCWFGGAASLAQAIRYVAPTNLLASALLIVAGYSGGPWHWPLWAAAVAVQWLPSLLSRRMARFPISAAHFGERHGLMIIIVLGESLVSVALAAEELPVSIGLVVGVLCGLGCSAAMWWCYFAEDDDRATQALNSPGDGPGPLLGYDLPHVLMMAGVVGVAAGSRLSLPSLTERTSLAAASLIAGGAALYLAGLALFRALLGYAEPITRLVTAIVLLAFIPLGRYAGAAQELAGLGLALAAMLLLERRFSPAEPA
jgi:low temperature requirement protein LtrA